MRTAVLAPPPAARTDWRPWRRAALALLLPVGGVILLGTLGPPQVAAAATWALVRLADRLPGAAAGYASVQALANLVMFVPVGALLALGTRPSRWPLAVLAGPALSLAAESAQRGIAGRVSDGFDLLTNSAGSLLGFVAGGAAVGAIALTAALGRLAGR